jgi:hypothetical protein
VIKTRARGPRTSVANRLPSAVISSESSKFRRRRTTKKQRGQCLTLTALKPCLAAPYRAFAGHCRAYRATPRLLPGRVAPYQAAYVLLRIVSDKVSVNAALSLQSVLWSKNHSGFAWAQAIDFWMTLLFKPSVNGDLKSRRIAN